ncbi:hypothetical protein MNB_SV-14-171 [hydrothermal vent metagenome]|uniref:Rhamnogalacturonase A/B/Epimerase-like pectate lyase domain-containing protein n=1 Tax=hydrothermal vent metagenome TaxID=652676 RepID=A0A1W1CNQ0_9ZZZZ
MKTDRRNFIKGAVVAGAVGIATAPKALRADGMMTNRLCVVVDTVDKLTTSLKNASDTVIVKDINRGGTFIYDSSKSDINDGGTIFNGWVRQYDGVLNVLWFGAIGDGVSDDTQAIQKAIFHATGWNGKLYNLDNSVAKIVYIPRGTYRITDSLKITQMQYIIGDGYGSGHSKSTEILCDFTNISPPTDNYSNIYEGHPSIRLSKKPMLYNIKMANYIKIEGIRFNANFKDVYGIHLNDMYYSKLDTISIINCMNSGLTLHYAQFNEVRNISYINNAGPIRIVNSCTIDFDNLDIENSQCGVKNDLEIVHQSKWKGGINIRNIHIEELKGKSNIVAGSVWMIGQKGVNIEGVFGLFSVDTESDSTKRYIHYIDPQEYIIDGYTFTTSIPHHCTLESVGSGHMYIKQDKEAYSNKIIGYRVEREEGSNDRHQIDTTTFDTGFEIRNQNRKKALWFENNNTENIHFFDNANRKFLGDGGHFIMENSYGRVKLKAGSVMPDINLIADFTSMNTMNGTRIASFELEKIKIHNLPTEDPNVKDQLWNDNGTLKISL